MRVIPSILGAAVTIGLIILLNMQLPVAGSKTPRLGSFLCPQTGFWQNAESANTLYVVQLKSDKLKGKVEVYLDDRLVPHVYADNESDAYFAQGYLHAKFRLWQMEFQTYYASGRLSEILGPKSGENDIVKVDQHFRRLGMVYAAERSLTEMENDKTTKEALDAYTAGVNNYIDQLDASEIPIEYKLLDYKPEHWTNLKTALFVKYMAYDLAGREEDFERTNARSVFTGTEYEKLYPYGQDLMQPIIPKNAVMYEPDERLPVPAIADSLYFTFKPGPVVDSTAMALADSTLPAVDSTKIAATPAAKPTKPAAKPAKAGAVKPAVPKPDKDNGSNNWALAGNRTQSGRPILCNDPHLGLNLPAIWYEMQISTPAYNAYGVSFPGAPYIVIGFNDSCAFGFTNAERDVKDYYEIQFKDSTMREYWYNNTWRSTSFRDEVIKIKGGGQRVEHIAMTIWGPVMYDASYPDPLNSGKAYACKWMAHEPSNELKTFSLLDRAKGYIDYLDALSYFKCPGQNMIFAAKSGDIAIRQQGMFPAKWRRQGDFVMPGTDSSFGWQGDVAIEENLTMYNPGRGYVSSANQYPYDTTYPYYQGGTFELFRGLTIDRYLAGMENATVVDMQKMQTDNYNTFAEIARPVLLKYLDESMLNADERKYVDLFKNWNLRSDAQEKAPTVLQLWWDSLTVCIFRDELSQSGKPLPMPEKATLIEALARDPNYQFIDDIYTPEKETIQQIVLKAYRMAIPAMRKQEQDDRLEWGAYKDGGVRHLLKQAAFSRLHIKSGGGENIINANKGFHGPSWRMIVELTDEINAYGVYPGGQNGNPGSKYYDMFIDSWAAGRYYKIEIASRLDMAKHKGLTGKLTFEKKS
ncbi:penicillin amidase [Filimonas zeae]|uniref:Penicillin amidase n=1 Tax=Filimonas zeae TaxID=1737353 RepID=A0A917IXK8_9BACT|nr:penicillin acylase family protein [Filimonas zeae]MDR6338437.1 penicillin amidase [Filimonas zeae]GGH68266.1 hypothetical protein GCM10011379_24390 [Filimonas zeae]